MPPTIAPAGVVAPAGLAQPEPPGYSSTTGTGSTLVCVLVAIIVIGVAVWLLLRRRSGADKGGPVATSRPDPGDPYGTIPTEQLANEANTLLVAADDALKTSEQELAFATGQYGPDATTTFTDTVAAARADITAAFHRRAQLDDETPDDEPTKRAWYLEIINRCRTADARLDDQVEAFDALRNLEANLDTLVPALAGRRDAAAAKLPGIQTGYESLKSRYAPSAILAIVGSAAQVQERLDFADQTLARARDALAAGDRPTAALGVRAVEEALAQIDRIDQGVDRLGQDLDRASAAVAGALADIESDVAAGQAAIAASPGGSAGTVDLAAAVAAAQQVATSLRTGTAPPDPFAALRRLEQVNTRLDAALAHIRDAADRADRARQLLDQAIPAAQAEIAAVTDFITTRRGAVGGQARTRLAEAERHLDRAAALSGTDPAAALAAARQADALAEQAGQLATEDVNGWSHPGYSGGLSTGGIGGAVLGGILLEAMLGGTRTGGFGGTNFGWGRRIPGSFGGPGTRVRIRV